MYILYVILAIFVLVVVAALIVSVSSHKMVEETAHYCEREGVYCIHAPHDDGCEVCQGCLVSATSSNVDE